MRHPGRPIVGCCHYYDLQPHSYKELNGKDLPGGKSVFTVRFEVKDVDELESIRNKLMAIPDVIGSRRGQN